MNYIYRLIILVCISSIASTYTMEPKGFFGQIWVALNEFCNQDVILDTFEPLNREEIRRKMHFLFHTTTINEANIKQYIAELNSIKQNANISPEDKSWLENKIKEIAKAIAQ